MQTLPRGFHVLEVGDNVENPDTGEWGSVHGNESVEPLILWPRGQWQDAETFMAAASRLDVPYRIQRSEE